MEMFKKTQREKMFSFLVLSACIAFATVKWNFLEFKYSRSFDLPSLCWIVKTSIHICIFILDGRPILGQKIFTCRVAVEREALLYFLNCCQLTVCWFGYLNYFIVIWTIILNKSDVKLKTPWVQIARNYADIIESHQTVPSL